MVKETSLLYCLFITEEEFMFLPRVLVLYEMQKKPRPGLDLWSPGPFPDGNNRYATLKFWEMELVSS